MLYYIKVEILGEAASQTLEGTPARCDRHLSVCLSVCLNAVLPERSIHLLSICSLESCASLLRLLSSLSPTLSNWPQTSRPGRNRRSAPSVCLACAETLTVENGPVSSSGWTGCVELGSGGSEQVGMVVELNLLCLCVDSKVQVCPPDIDYIDIPSSWWDKDADKSLLIGVHKHGRSAAPLLATPSLGLTLPPLALSLECGQQPVGRCLCARWQTGGVH